MDEQQLIGNENFKYIKYLGIVIFVVFLVVLCYKMFQRYWGNEIKWPKNISHCPDYWKDMGNGKCRNINNLGNCQKKMVGFKKNNNKKKCRWAKRCNVSWEGIDNLC